MMEMFQCMDKQTRYAMLLAPFQQMTRIELETYINTSVECYLDIKNPSNKTLNVIVTKTPDVKRHITLNLMELEIPEKSNRAISIKWSPKEAGCWRDVLQLTDSRRIKYDIVIATTAKGNKKKAQKKPLKPVLSKSSVCPVSATNTRFRQENTLLSVPINGRPLVANTTTQMKWNKPKSQNGWNKENISSRNDEIKVYVPRKEIDDMESTIRDHEHCKSKNVLSEEHVNVWNDGSTLPQVFLPSNTPQDIRRATYLKETKHCNNILYKHTEEVIEDTACTRNDSQSDFSVLIDKLTFSSMDVITSSSLPMKTESMEFVMSQNTEETCAVKNRTFAIDHKMFEISKISNSEIDGIDLPSVSYPKECHELSFKDNTNSLIASSPIMQLQYNDISKDEHFKYFIDRINHSIQTDYEYFSCETIPDNIKAAKKAGDIYIEISPPRKHSYPKSLFISRLSPSLRTGRITKEKPLCENKNVKKLQLSVPVSKKSIKNIPAIKVNKSSLNVLRQIKTHIPSSKESGFKIHNREDSIYETFELDPFVLFTTENPFLKNTIHYDEQWLVQQEIAFTKWLNFLLSAPEDLYVNIDNVIANTNKIWQIDNLQKDYYKEIETDTSVETKKATSARYADNRLHAIRKAASAMFHRKEVIEVNSRITRCVVEGTLFIRLDRNLHRDLGLQKEILSLFLCYNPLWLRIGLETVYDERIPLRNNNDLIGLTRFLHERFFTNPRLTKMSGYHKTDPSKKFVTLLNQFMLKKFLFLVYFLDYAKQHKLIGHDPCLFHKHAVHKASRDILLHFSRGLLASVGDVTKMLRAYDYVVTYRQTYIDEYDYAVTDIRTDLRDGVRLCRVMELITGVKDLIRQCRVPAISRLQKIHNVDLALKMLHQIGHVFTGDIDAKSIADGHREKTLSLLWQIVHKYQAPRFNQAARVIQKWWRSHMWYTRVKNYLYARKNHSAIVIQRAWRRKARKTLQIVTLERWKFLRMRTAVIFLQRWWRWVRGTAYMKKLHELRERRLLAVITLQRKWRATLLMRTQRNQYCDLRNATLMIQTRWRARRAIKLQRLEYLRIRRDAAVRIQSWWKSIKIMRENRKWFIRCKKSVRIIQAWWLKYLSKCIAAVLTIERWWISVNARKKYLRVRTSTVLIQRTWRKYQVRKHERQNACLRIQTWWRTVLYSRRYKHQRACCVKLQQWWRKRRHYLKRKQAVSLIGSWYLCVKSRRNIRLRYLQIKTATIRIQNWWRTVLVARKEREGYQQLRRNVIILQNHWRRCILFRRDRQQFLSKRRACVTLQAWWRMIRIKRLYKRYRNCVLMMQTKWRAIKIGRLTKKEYQEIRMSVVVVQAHWRGFVARRQFLIYRQAALVIQSYYRMRIAIQRYKNVKRAALTIQSYWRRYKQKKIEEELLLYQQEDLAAIIQSEYGIHQEKILAKHGLPGREYWQEQINVLRTCDSVGALLTCLSSLDTITKLSPTVCITLCQLKLVDEIYKTITLRNRSQPWMNVCQQACSILITLAKYPYTKKYIVKQEHTLLLVKLLSDTLKEKEVFLHCATLIWLLSQDEDYSKAMMIRSDINWLLKNIQQKVLKDATMAKLKKLEKLYPNSESDRSNTHLFTNMSVAITAIVKNICTCTNS